MLTLEIRPSKTYWHAYNLDSDVFSAGKTRTKDKYRVVYTDHQRLELEKEFHYSRYITIRRKSELASVLGLSERQVMIVPRNDLLPNLKSDRVWLVPFWISTNRSKSGSKIDEPRNANRWRNAKRCCTRRNWTLYRRWDLSSNSSNTTSTPANNSNNTCNTWPLFSMPDWWAILKSRRQCNTWDPSFRWTPSPS